MQAQVLDLLKTLQRDFGLTYLFVAHNLDVVRGFCDRVAVMRQGRILEQARTEDIFEALHRRRRSSFPEASLDELREAVHGSESPTGDPVVQAEVDHRLLEACLARVRGRVKPRHWQVFEAHALHGLSAEETARRYDSTAANVWVVRHRILKALRAEWQNLLSKPFLAEGKV